MALIPSPTDEQAKAFVVMLRAGLPSEQAILYFCEGEDAAHVARTHQTWMRSKLVARAQRELLGKDWADMSLAEQIETALNQHYASQAYLLFSVNYITASGVEKGKLDTARQALEAKKAGTSGQMSALDRFFADVKTGTVKLGKPAALPEVVN